MLYYSSPIIVQPGILGGYNGSANAEPRSQLAYIVQPGFFGGDNGSAKAEP